MTGIRNATEFRNWTQEGGELEKELKDGAEPERKKENDSQDSYRMTKELLTEEFTANRERLWRTVQVRMDSRLYGRVDPDDVLQEAYMDAMKRVGHFAEELNYSPFVWLRLIVGQTLINVHRRHIKPKCEMLRWNVRSKAECVFK